MPYKIERTDEFKAQYKKLTRKERGLQKRLDKQLVKIIKDPSIGEPKKHDLKYTRGSHVDPFVIVFMIINDNILFLNVGHHDLVYRETPRILGNIEFEFPELWDVMPQSLRQHLRSVH